MKRLLPLLLSILVLISCTTVVSGERPGWVVETPVIAGFDVFVGEGVSADRTGARSLALLDVLEKMGDATGLMLSELYYRELYQEKEIPELGAVLADEYTERNEDGTFRVHVAVKAESVKMAQTRSAEYLEMLEREERMRSLLSLASQSYRENRDTEAASFVLLAMLEGAEGDVKDPDLGESVLLERALGYLSRLRVKGARNRKGSGAGDISFSVCRSGGFMDAGVEECRIVFIYDAIDERGNISSFSHTTVSDGKGRFVFSATNPLMVRAGSLVAKPALDESVMSSLVEKVSPETVSAINEALDAAGMVCSYSLHARLDGSSAVIGMAEYGYGDVTLGEDGEMEGILSSFMEKLGITGISLCFASGEEEEDNLLSIAASYGGERWVYLLRIGVVENRKTGGSVFSRTEGKLIALDSVTGERKETLFHAVATGESVEEAERESRRSISKAICAYLFGEF